MRETPGVGNQPILLDRVGGTPSGSRPAVSILSILLLFLAGVATPPPVRAVEGGPTTGWYDHRNPPPPPEGFSWDVVPEFGAALLVPEGWHSWRLDDPRMPGVFVTKEHMEGEVPYWTGLGLRVVPLPSASHPHKTPEEFASIWIGTMAASASDVFGVWEGRSGPFSVYSCRVRIDRMGVPVIRHWAAVAVPSSETVYLLTFESPERQWEYAWPTGQMMLGMLALGGTWLSLGPTDPDSADVSGGDVLQELGVEIGKGERIGGLNDLGEPPAGFTWKRVEQVRMAFLLAKGWHFSLQEQEEGGTTSFFLTREDLAEDGSFRTGLSVDITRPNGKKKKARRSATARARAEIDKIVGSGRLIRRWDQGEVNGLHTFGCRIVADSEQGPLIVHAIAIGNEETGTLYRMRFQAPASDWEEAWKTGVVMLARFAIETEI